MSGEQITNNSVETQTLESELHSLKDSSKKKRVDINDLLNKVRLAQKKEKINRMQPDRIKRNVMKWNK